MYNERLYTGLAEQFKSDKYQSTKWCGKACYKSPEIVSRGKPFDAMKNDIWCLGMTVLMMVSGVTPWLEATNSDHTFAFFSNFGIGQLLALWRFGDLSDPELSCRWIGLFEIILKYEADRADLTEIKQYIQLYMH